MSYVSATIGAANIFSQPIVSFGSTKGERNLAVSIEGTFAATVSLQRSLDGGLTYHTLSVYAVASEVSIVPTTGAYYRVGINAGAYTSGAAIIKIML